MVMLERGTNTNSPDENVTDHDLLVSLSRDVSWLKKIMSNHLAHHWIITISVAASMLTAIGVLVMYIITK
jgi:hypothetical protein